MKNKRFLPVVLILLATLVIGFTVAVNAEENWDEIIAAAKKEGLLVIYNPSSRMGEAAEGFTAEYGIEVQWSKMNDVEVSDKVAREHAAKVRGADLIVTEDAAILMAQLLPGGFVENYLPSTHKDLIPEEYQNPLIYQFQPRIIGYNTESYSEPPITSLWDLTTPEWRGKFMMRDPQTTSTNLAWFAEIIEAADEMEAAYERRFGEPIKLTTENAGWEFVKLLAQNRPIMFQSDTSVSDAVGARGQADPAVGLYVLSKHREIESKNLALDAIYDLDPVMGYLYPAYVLITTNAASPNAAKLFVQYLLDEGVKAWSKYLGNFATNTSIPPHEDDPLGGTEEWAKVTMPLDANTTVKYYGEIFDFWMQYAN